MGTVSMGAVPHLSGTEVHHRVMGGRVVRTRYCTKNGTVARAIRSTTSNDGVPCCCIQHHTARAVPVSWHSLMTINNVWAGVQYLCWTTISPDMIL